MTYQQALTYLHSHDRFGKLPSLSGIQMLTSLCGDPQGDLRFIHVAGTNGKGSTCAMLSNIMQQAGYRTGLYCSPYVVDFRERIQVDGEYISESDWVWCIETIRPHVTALKQQGMTFTQFELLTAAALLYFQKQACDVVILEVGLGGRFDATNVIAPPDVAVITHIDLDHTAVLGSTYAEIAREKCGIIKKGTSAVVCYPHQEPSALQTIKTIGEQRAVNCILPTAADICIDAFGAAFTYKKERISLSMIGVHQVYNAVTAAAAADAFGVPMPCIARGIAKTTVPARMEMLRKDPLVLLDGSHNVDGISALTRYLSDHTHQKAVVVVGMLEDKNAAEAMRILCAQTQSVITVAVDNPRTISAERLAHLAKDYCSDVTVSDAEHCLALAEEKANGAPIVLCGSLYLASSLRPKATAFYQTT